MRLLWTAVQLLSISLWAALRFRISPAEVARQFFEAGNRSMLFVTVTMAFVGMIGVYQLAYAMGSVLPEYSTLGPAVLQSMIREMGPILSAGLLMATRVGTGIAAEIGSMKVTDQLDAMKLSSVDPVELLVLPRLIACCMAGLSLAVLGIGVAYGVGSIVAYYGFDVLPDTYFSLRFVTLSDVSMGTVKSLLFGFTVPLVSSACGFDAEGGSEGVGSATTKAVVFSSFVVILEDAVVSFVFEVMLAE
jgi:phospholipid/cholesterol/gamma-HCH transport system permease protein